MAAAGNHNVRQTLEGRALTSAIDSKKCEALTEVDRKRGLLNSLYWLPERHFVHLGELVNADL